MAWCDYRDHISLKAAVQSQATLFKVQNPPPASLFFSMMVYPLASDFSLLSNLEGWHSHGKRHQPSVYRSVILLYLGTAM